MSSLSDAFRTVHARHECTLSHTQRHKLMRKREKEDERARLEAKRLKEVQEHEERRRKEKEREEKKEIKELHRERNCGKCGQVEAERV